MVEFAFVLPIFLVVIIAFVEFGFAFSTLNSLNFTSRDLALYASEAGNQDGSDCSMLAILERQIGAAAKRSGIASVRIYWSDGAGNVVNGAVNHYDRVGSLVCTDITGLSRTLPYTAVTANYPEATRCPVLRGCPAVPGGFNHPVLDTIGIQLTYRYDWRTPLAHLLSFNGPATFIATQQIRIEPVL